jgi:hypothetical protein
MHTGYFFMMVFFIFPLIGLLLYTFYFNKYTFEKKIINYFLVLNMFLGSPIGILLTVMFNGLKIKTSTYEILQYYFVMLIVMILTGSFKYSIWYLIFRRESNNLLIYSKKFIFQIPYLTLLFYPWWSLHDMDFALGFTPSMIICEIIIFFSVAIISIHQLYKAKKKEI